MVHRVLQHRLGLVAAAEGQIVRQVILRVQIELDGHGSGDAAHVPVPFHRAGIPALGDLSPPRGGNVLFRGVLDVIRKRLIRTVLQIGQRVQQHVEHCLELAVDAAQVCRQGVSGSVQRGMQSLQLRGDRP